MEKAKATKEAVPGLLCHLSEQGDGPPLTFAGDTNFHIVEARVTWVPLLSQPDLYPKWYTWHVKVSTTRPQPLSPRGGGARVYAELGEGACRRSGCEDTRACGGAGGGRGRGARVHGREECVWTTGARGGRRECLRGERAGGGVWMSVRGVCGWSRGRACACLRGGGANTGVYGVSGKGGGAS